MKIYQIVISGFLAVSTTVFADQADNPVDKTSSIPPQMRDSMRQQWMVQNQPPMQMMGGPNRGMMMDPQMMQNMMAMRQQGMPYMPSGSMMDAQQMHNMMKVHTDQMRKMEKKLTSIELLLSELVSLQKGR